MVPLRYVTLPGTGVPPSPQKGHGTGDGHPPPERTWDYWLEVLWDGEGVMVCSHCLSLDTGTGTVKKWVVWYNAERFTLHRDQDPIVSHCAGPGPCSGFGPGVSQCEWTITPPLSLSLSPPPPPPTVVEILKILPSVILRMWTVTISQTLRKSDCNIPIALRLDHATGTVKLNPWTNTNNKYKEYSLMIL